MIKNNILYIVYYFHLSLNSILHVKANDYNPQSILEFPGECGLSAYGTTSCDDSTSRIVGGEYALNDEFPWQVLLKKDNITHCGGGLLSSKVVITAAHCLSNGTFTVDPKRITALFGVNDRFNFSANVSIIQAEKVIIHPEFNFTDLLNDIALIQLSHSVNFSVSIIPICLPANDSLLFNGYPATVAGWGREYPHIDSYSRYLQFGIVKVLRNRNGKCTRAVGRKVPDTLLCAYDGYSDSCKGDSGSPLIALLDRQCTIIGVTSFGVGCGNYGYAGVYTRVSKYLDWIHNHTLILEND